jgi:hypothetical protein
MVPNIGPICILFIVWVYRNAGKEDVKNVSCIDPDTGEENITGCCSLGITLQYNAHVFEVLLHVLYDVTYLQISHKIYIVLWLQVLTQT